MFKIFLLAINSLKLYTEIMETGNSEILKCCAWNMRSMSSGLPYLKQLMANNDIIIASEHGLYNCQLWKLNEISNEFSVNAKSCKTLRDEDCSLKVRHSGVALFWKASLNQYIKPVQVDSDRICAVELYLTNNQSIIIASVYLPHKSSSIASFTDEINILESLVTEAHMADGVVIMGDINAHFGREHSERCWGKPRLMLSSSTDLRSETS